MDLSRDFTGVHVVFMRLACHMPCTPQTVARVAIRKNCMGKVSGGCAATILGMSRIDFIHHACDLGIPYLRIVSEDLDNEIQVGRSL